MSKLVQQLTESQALDRYLTEVSAALKYQSGYDIKGNSANTTTVLVKHVTDHVTVFVDVFLDCINEEMEVIIDYQYDDGTESFASGLGSFECPIAVENLTWTSYKDAGSIRTQLSELLTTIYSILSKCGAYSWDKINKAMKENGADLRSKMPRQWPEKPPF